MSALVHNNKTALDRWERGRDRRGQNRISRDPNVLIFAIAPIQTGELTGEIVGASFAAEKF